MIQCQECSRQISHISETCPYCGSKNTTAESVLKERRNIFEVHVFRCPECKIVEKAEVPESFALDVFSLCLDGRFKFYKYFASVIAVSAERDPALRR